jgi:hypothetical protein
VLFPKARGDFHPSFRIEVSKVIKRQPWEYPIRLREEEEKNEFKWVFYDEEVELSAEKINSMIFPQQYIGLGCSYPGPEIVDSGNQVIQVVSYILPADSEWRRLCNLFDSEWGWDKKKMDSRR